jgi:hypothetical protein
VWTACQLEPKDDSDFDPFSTGNVVAERFATLHPDVLQHLTERRGVLARPLRQELNQIQVALIEQDFQETLECWDKTLIPAKGAMWQCLEASRYCFSNPLFREATADVNVAVKLLVPESDAADWHRHSVLCVGIRAHESEMGVKTSPSLLCVLLEPLRKPRLLAQLLAQQKHRHPQKGQSTPKAAAKQLLLLKFTRKLRFTLSKAAA